MLQNKIKAVNKKGFTLVEVIIAMAIITIVATTFYKVYFVAIKSTNAGKQNLQALNLAQNYLEEVAAKKDLDRVKQPTEEGYEFQVYTTKEETSESGKLITVVVKVTPKDTKPVQLGTKIYVKAN